MSSSTRTQRRAHFRELQARERRKKVARRLFWESFMQMRIFHPFRWLKLRERVKTARRRLTRMRRAS